jgi:hydrogenase maturation protease
MDAPCLNIDQYESGRPSAEEACRDGDIRFARFVAKADK